MDDHSGEMEKAKEKQDTKKVKQKFASKGMISSADVDAKIDAATAELQAKHDKELAKANAKSGKDDPTEIFQAAMAQMSKAFNASKKQATASSVEVTPKSPKSILKKIITAKNPDKHD